MKVRKIIGHGFSIGHFIGMLNLLTVNSNNNFYNLNKIIEIKNHEGLSLREEFVIFYEN